jgi:hypothetical protein
MLRAPVLALLAFAGGASAFPASHYRLVDRPGTPLYYGHVALCDRHDGEGPGAEILRDPAPEPATPNVPLVPGDRLVTPSGVRCEAEFDTGTVVQLDGESELRLETVLAPSLSSAGKLTNLALETGRARVRYRSFDGNEVFQILTPQAAVKLARSAAVEVVVARDGATSISVERGAAAVLFGPSDRKLQRRSLDAGERLTVVAHREAPTGPDPVPDGLARWSEVRDRARTPPPQEGRPLPATLRGLPPAVQDFAERFSREHGSWVWTTSKQHAWRPHLSSAPGWRPYLQGRFSAAQGRAFWVADEPWGWVPYHLGFWDLDDDAGWVWLPGSTFAPAWVSWSHCNDLHAWSAFGPGAWRLYRDTGMPWIAPFCSGSNLAWYQYPWSSQWSEAPVRPPQYAKRRGAETPVPPTAPPPPERPRLPPHLRRMGDELDRMAKHIGGPRPNVPIVFSKAEASPEAPGRAENGPAGRKPVEGSEPRAVTSPAVTSPAATQPAVALAHEPGPGSPGRFRDWNPDVRVAREAGVRIRYDSASNQVICDGCLAAGARGEAGALANSSLASSSAGGAAGNGVAGASSTAGPMGGGGAAASRSGPIEK